MNRVKEFGPIPDLFRRLRRLHGFEWSPDTDIVINTTSIGLYPNVDQRLFLDLDALTPAMVVADGIHNPPRTHLIREAEARGCRVLDGLGMLVNQGVIGIKYWTGVDVDPAVMRRSLDAIFRP